MVNEKMKILKMLEEGRITSDEAARLLESVDSGRTAAASPAGGAGSVNGDYPGGRSGGAHPSSPYPSSASNDPTGKRRPSAAPYPSDKREAPRRPEYRADRPGESFTDEITRKFESFFKDMEPKLQKFTETVVEKTSSAADAISRSISSPPPSKTAPHRPQPTQKTESRPSSGPAPKGRMEKNFELKVATGGSELNISGFNGQVLLKGYNGDKISAKVYYTAKRGSPAMELMVLGSKYYLNYDENDFESVSVDAYIPESMFFDVKALTSNGALVVSTIKCEQARLENTNGDIEVNGLVCLGLDAETNNGSVRLKGIAADRAIIDNFNGPISAADLDVAQLKMSTFNGGITMHAASFDRYGNYMWAVESNNGKVGMILPSSVDFGYYVKANAALSDVKIGLTGLSYISNGKSFAEAQSVNFDVAPKKIKLLAESSNAPITVN